MTVRIFHTTLRHVVHQAEPKDHHHGPNCGHESVNHAGQHVDYLVDGHAHHAHEGHWDECNVQDMKPSF